MAAPCVWARLCCDEGKDEGCKDEPAPVKIAPIPESIGALVEALTRKEFDGEDGTAIDLAVYPAGTASFSNEKNSMMDPAGNVPPNTTIESPLVVVVKPIPWSAENTHQRAAQADPLDDSHSEDNSDLDECPGEIDASDSGSTLSSVSTSSEGFTRRLFRNAVLGKDGGKCVVSGTRYAKGSGNVQATHIVPLSTKQEVAYSIELYNFYDTYNGMLLEAKLRKAFESHLWCLNEDCEVCVSRFAGDAKDVVECGILKHEGSMVVFPPNYGPSKAILSFRYKLFHGEASNREKKRKIDSKGMD